MKLCHVQSSNLTLTLNSGNFFIALISIIGIHPTNVITLYLDGVFKAKVFMALTLLTDQHKLQAVQVEGTFETHAAFLASSSNGVKTDESWSCANVYHKGWFLSCYNDTAWPKAFVLGPDLRFHFIAQDAKWIEYDKNSKRIYCRRRTTGG